MIFAVGSSIEDDKNEVYALVELIGRGAHGYVFKAVRKSDHAVFALKSMLPSFGESTIEEAFINEVESAMQIKGDNIIRYEYVHNGELFPHLPPYIIMEYADGGTLTSILKQKRATGDIFDSVTLKEIYIQLALGMQEINRKLIHRDIKPDNILKCGDKFKISDFGLSKILVENTRTMTFKGCGTPLYMAPEAWDFSKNTIQMDIYSMGIVFYELAALRYPYEPVPSTLEDCKNVHLFSPIVSLEDINRSMPSNMISIINRMLQKVSSKRFGGWQEIVQLLENCCEPASPLDEIVAMAVKTKNAENLAHQKRDSEEKRKRKEKTELCKLVRHQLEQSVIAPMKQFAEKVNMQYAGSDKISFPDEVLISSNGAHLSWKMHISSNNSLSINAEVLFKENFRRNLSYDLLLPENSTWSENYLPQYGGKDIRAWAEIINKSGYGFNLLLVECDEIYGEWLIMKNFNNLSNLRGKTRLEPFPFKLNELPDEIEKVQVMHLYRSEFETLDEIKFVQLISKLLFNQ